MINGIENMLSRVVMANISDANMEFLLYLIVRIVPVVLEGMVAMNIATILTVSSIGSQT
jgi:hypothetical protein